MRALTELEKAGYAILLEGEQIRLCYRGGGRPDPSTVRPLMEDVKEHKGEALAILRDRETCRIFREALHELSAAWVPGLLEHTKKHHADIWNLIQEADEALEKTWTLTLAGTMTMADFQDAVTAWRDAYRLTIEEHRKRGCEECDVKGRMECATFWRQREGDP